MSPPPAHPHPRPAPDGPHRFARSRTLGAIATAVAVAFALAGAVLPGTAAAQPPLTQVSLTFDDANANQMTAATTLTSNGLRGTFYVPSGLVGAPDYMTVANLNTLAAGGHEIGGHTVTHPDLTTLPADEAARQVCNDRVNLTDWGFQVTSFAYPFAASTAATEQIVADCGYNSARGLGDIESRFGCAGCGFSEQTPPANPYYTRALDMVDSTWTLQDLQDAVTNAENNGGGWVQFTFHHVCDGCDPLSVSPALFDQFTTWLAAREATNNTVVRTVHEVIGGTVAPATPGPVVEPPAPGENAVKNPSLETPGSTSLPQCWFAGGYGVNTPTFTTTTTAAEARTGTKAEVVDVTGYVSGDAKLLPTFDLGGCSPTVVPGHTYSLRAWYKSTAVTQFVVYYRTGIGTWAYWTSSPWFAAATDWTQATWTTPPIPDGATGLSFGLSMFNNGTVTTDDYEMYDAAGAPEATASSAQTARIEPVPPAARAPRVTVQSPVYAQPRITELVGPVSHRARPDRHGPPPQEIHFVPGPGLVEPGTPFAVVGTP